MQSGQRLKKESAVDPNLAKLPTVNGIPLEPINQIMGEGEEGALYISDVDAAKDLATLRRYNIRAVLTVAPNAGLNYSKRDVDMHKVIPADDEEDYNLAQHFSQSFDFIDRARKGYNVLVHCLAGVSRSTTIVIAYLMRRYKWRTDQAYQTVKSKRRLTCPNLGFCRQLKQFQKQLGLSDKPASPQASRLQMTASPRQYQEQASWPTVDQSRMYSPAPSYQGRQSPSGYPPPYTNFSPKKQTKQSFYAPGPSARPKSPHYPVGQFSKDASASQYAPAQHSMSAGSQFQNQYPSGQSHHSTSPYHQDQYQTYQTAPGQYMEQQQYGYPTTKRQTNSGYNYQRPSYQDQSYRQDRTATSYSSYGGKEPQYYFGAESRLNSPRKNYRPFGYGNYSRPFNTKNGERGFRSREGAQLRASGMWQKEGIRRSRVMSGEGRREGDLGRSRFGMDMSGIRGRNYSVEKFAK